MLINLTNHPSENWDQTQKEMASVEYGEIIDLPFPAIQPESNEEMIVNLSEEYFRKCKELLNNAPESSAVHIMGEMTFSFALVTMLLRENIKCVASTTRRKASQYNNIRTSEFIFCRFREYRI